MPWPMIPISGAAIRRALPMLTLLAGIVIAAMALKRAYGDGFEAGRAEAALIVAAARLQATEDLAKAQRKLFETEQSMRQLEQQYAERLEAARAAQEVQVRTVERVIRENPEFADIVRPAGLQLVRDEQLAAIAAAAAGGAATAAQLPRAGLSSMPTPGDRNRRDTGRDGAGGH